MTALITSVEQALAAAPSDTVKVWKRRSAVTLEDFLADAGVQKTHALQTLGIAIAPGSIQSTDDLTVRLQRVREVAGDLKEAITEYLRKNGVTAFHDVHPGPQDTSKLIVFRWDASAEPLGTQQRVELNVALQPPG